MLPLCWSWKCDYAHPVATVPYLSSPLPPYQVASDHQEGRAAHQSYYQPLRVQKGFQIIRAGTTEGDTVDW